ncbi:MAG: transporter [Opitutaceae bacterium]
MKTFPSARTLLVQLSVFVCLPFAVHAIEGGAPAFPNGGEDFHVAAMPPPGWYGLLYSSRYHADFLADDAGNSAVPSFGLTVNALTPRIDWVKPASVLGADRWGTLFILPVLDLDLALAPAPGVSLTQRRRALGDLTIGNGLHWTFQNFDMINSVDLVIPLGSYDSTRLVNPGQNRWVVRLNHIGTWRPAPAWDVSYRLHTDFNFRNSATGYESGQTAYLNVAVGWSPQRATTLGIAGYSLRQLTDDRQAGRSVGPTGNRVRVDGLGPCVKHVLPNHVMLVAKYFHEFNARNRPKGGHAWLYVAVPLGAPSK